MLKKSSSLLGFLICLTLLAIAAQMSFFVIHYKVTDLLDSFVQSSLRLDAMHLSILLPLFNFLLIQLLSYSLAVAWIWFVSVSVGELFRLPKNKIFWFGVMVWVLHCYWIVSLNQHFFPGSFFAAFLPVSHVALIAVTVLIGLLAGLAYLNLFLLNVMF